MGPEHAKNTELNLKAFISGSDIIRYFCTLVAAWRRDRGEAGSKYGPMWMNLGTGR